jgi:peptidase M28-like protein
MKGLWLAASISLVIPGVVQAQTEPVDEAARTITEDDFDWRVGVIAHDSMQGRNTPSTGLDKTAEWIASEFRRMGLRGGVDGGGFIQRYPLKSVVVDQDRSTLVAGSARLAFGADVLPLFGAATDGDAGADLVLVSGRGDLSRSSQRVIAGKHVALIVSREQVGLDRALRQLIFALRGAGASSVLVSVSMDDDAWAANAGRALRPSVSKGWSAEGAESDDFAPMLQIRTGSLARMLEGRNIDIAALQARAMDGVQVHDTGGLRTTLVMRTHEEETTAPNVVGILEGSDPELKSEFVVFSGHMDHVGMGTPDMDGDSIFNGADDDASGTAAVMEIAEAMSGLPTPPRRSMLFLLVSGEEKGLWGSEWFADNPTVPIESLVADLNTDMVGRNWPDTIVAIGKEHSDLGETMNEVNEAHPELRMTAIDDVWPEERFYFRSDHYNFARKGVPILFFFNGTHEDYHGRNDEPERIDAEKAARIARLVFYMGIAVGNADERPKWNPDSYARIVSD